MLQNLEHTLANLLCYGENIHCCKNSQNWAHRLATQTMKLFRGEEMNNRIGPIVKHILMLDLML